ncbi:MAG: hypothetical protein RJB64_1350, partial [Pseudomonadota bacterium]
MTCLILRPWRRPMSGARPKV